MGRRHVVDLGQDAKPEAIGHGSDPIEEVVDLRLDHEAGGPGTLDDVADGIEPDDADAMPGQRAEPAGDEGPGLGSIDVQIDLLGPVGGAEGRPDALAGAAVRDRDRRERRVRPAKEEARDVRCRRLAIGPDLVERDEQVGEGGATTVPLEVTELVASSRQVVDHEVEHDVVVRGDPPDVGPGAEARVDLAIRGRREAAIRGRRERRQDVHAPEQARQRPRQQRRERGQVPAERIGVREQLRTSG